MSIGGLLIEFAAHFWRHLCVRTQDAHKSLHITPTGYKYRYLYP